MALLSIGDFSVASHLSVKALRHYDEVGLLEPVARDPRSGYRRYGADQLARAQLIRRLRRLEMPVPEVRLVLDAPDEAARDRIIAGHLDRLEASLAETRSAITELRTLLDADPAAIDVTVRQDPAVSVAAITDVVSLDELGPWWEEAWVELWQLARATSTQVTGFAGGAFAQELFSAERGEATLYLPTATAMRSARVRTVDLPPATLAVTVHHGSDGTADRTYGALGAWVAEHHRGADTPPVRERYVVAHDAVDDDAERRTEIGWPLAEDGDPGA